MVYKVESTYKILAKLADHGWISLISMTTLLGYNQSVTIYQRQKTKRKIPTIRVGGINRVYEADVLETLAQKSDEHTKTILSLYKRIKGDD
ncbi:MAG: hypothetical protein COA78_31440 [Blastopirellula sp.]|nr:MAG: hypothetical protein COA78_31440 [Blastopirellula sp.]